MQVRASIQRALGRPLPLEEIGTMTIGGLKALAVAAGGSTACAPPTVPARAAPEKPLEVKQPEKGTQKQEAAKQTEKAAGAVKVNLFSGSIHDITPDI